MIVESWWSGVMFQISVIEYCSREIHCSLAKLPTARLLLPINSDSAVVSREPVVSREYHHQSRGGGIRSLSQQQTFNDFSTSLALPYSHHANSVLSRLYTIPSSNNVYRLYSPDSLAIMKTWYGEGVSSGNSKNLKSNKGGDFTQKPQKPYLKLKWVYVNIDL